MPKLAPAEVTLVDVAEIGADPAHRTALTPFGGRPGRPQRYVGRAVPWKRNKDAMPSAVVKGLANAQAVGAKCKGVKGIAINPLNGEVIPHRALCMLKASGKVKT